MDDFDLGIGDLSLGSPGAGPDVDLGLEDETMREARLRQIATLPPGPQKERAMALMLRDYDAESKVLDSEDKLATDLLAADSPKGTHLGGRYSTYVAASPLEHMATALRQYGGAKKLRQARDAREAMMSDDMENRKRMMMANTGGGTKYGMYHRP
jgi:hypothetical protein